MPCEYQLLEPDGHLIDTLTDDENGIRLQVDRHGAQPISLARRDAAGNWTGFLWRDGEVAPTGDGWKSHCTVMGYFIHRLKDEKSTYRGKPIRGGTHSFVRHKDFAAPAINTGIASLAYTITPADYQPEEYPFAVQMTLTYTIDIVAEAPELLVTFEFENLEPEQSVHVSFGLHPGFALASLAEGQVLLPAGTYIRHMAPGNFLNGETLRIEHAGGPMPFDKAELPDSFLLELAEVPERIFTVTDPAGHRCTDLDYQEAPYLTLWSDGNAFVCVEPCWGLPDHQEQRPFEQKEGLQEIPVGRKLTKSFAIRPQVTK